DKMSSFNETFTSLFSFGCPLSLNSTLRDACSASTISSSTSSSISMKSSSPSSSPMFF
ncbi:unnamed protein product, partial [Rotaria socialis]